MSEGYQEGHLVVDPLEKAKEKEGSAVDDKSTQKYYANAPDGEILPNQGAEDEEAEVDDAKDTSKLGGAGSFLGRLQRVEGGLEGGAESNAGLDGNKNANTKIRSARLSLPFLSIWSGLVWLTNKKLTG